MIMKFKWMFGLLLVTAIVVGAVSCSESDVLPTVAEEQLESAALINPTALGTLDDEQVQMLLFVFEEEKMARDVYRYLYDLWGANVFYNIIQSEQTHKDAMEQLLITYEIDYTDDDISGQFVNETIQNLYNSLIADGEQSLVAALDVGMYIEDFDIADLSDHLSSFIFQDVVTVLTDLIEGSKNHLRAFYNNQITIDPEYSYTPEFISVELYDEILSSSNAHGNAHGNSVR